MRDVTSLAAELIGLPSVNPPGGEQPVVDVLAALLARLGVDHQRLPVAGHGDTILARLPGRGDAPARLFTAHTDVVGVSDAERARWASEPFAAVQRDGHLIGRGAADTKGGLAALVLAASDVVGDGRTPPGDLVLVITSDEEDRMTGSKAVVDHPWLSGDGDLVVCEPTSLRPCTVGRGRTWAEVTLHATTGHGSSPTGPNALELATDLMLSLRDEDFSDVADLDHGLSFWRPLALHAGVEPCVVPDACTLTLDARLVPDHDPDDVWRRLDALLEPLRRRGVRVDVDVIDRREGWRTPADAPLVIEARAALAAEGLPGPQPSALCFPGTTDGTVLRRATAGRPPRHTLVLGPGDLTRAHRENESVPLSELDAARRVYRHLMLHA